MSHNMPKMRSNNCERVWNCNQNKEPISLLEAKKLVISHIQQLYKFKHNLIQYVNDMILKFENLAINMRENNGT